jgi:solute carrier family 35, member E3
MVASSASHQEEEMSDGAASRMGVAGALGLSVTSSVAIVICNKYLISSLGFFFGKTPAFRFFTA